MNLKLLTILVFSLYAITSCAQEAYNFRYDYGLIQSVGLIIDEIDHSYITIGKGFKNEGTFEEIMFFNEIDKKTGKSKALSLLREEAGITIRKSNSIALYNNKVFVPVNFIDSLYLIKYDLSSKDISFLAPYFFRDTLTGNSIFNYGMKQQGKFLFILHTFWHDSQEIIITKFNLENEQFSHIRLIDEKNDLIGAALHLKPNGNIVVFGFDNTDRIYITEINPSGDKIWEYYSDYALNLGFIFGGVALEDEFYGITANRFTPNGKSIPVVIGFNGETKEIEWINDFGFTFDLIESYYYNIIPSHNDSAFLYVGNVFEYIEPQDSLIRHGRIGKIDKYGKSIWNRNYSAFGDSIHSNSGLVDIIATSDGHYITAGESSHQRIFIDKPETLIQSWVLKIDEDGHIVPTDSVSGVTFGDHDLNGKISVFPNPASDQLIINQDDLSNVDYHVYSIEGQLIDQMHIQNPNHSTVWNISNWNAGIYIIQVVVDGRVYKSERVRKL